MSDSSMQTILAIVGDKIDFGQQVDIQVLNRENEIQKTYLKNVQRLFGKSVDTIDKNKSPYVNQSMPIRHVFSVGGNPVTSSTHMTTNEEDEQYLDFKYSSSDYKIPNVVS